MKTWAAILVLASLALGLASCANNETREQKFAHTQQLAQKGDREAQYNLGLMYEQGYGIAPDQQQAAAWFEKAAAQGSAPAQAALGNLYLAGAGVPKDFAKAAYWHKKSLKQRPRTDITLK